MFEARDALPLFLAAAVIRRPPQEVSSPAM